MLKVVILIPIIIIFSMILFGCGSFFENMGKLDPNIQYPDKKIDKEFAKLPKFEDINFVVERLPLPDDTVEIDQPAEMVYEAIPEYPGWYARLGAGGIVVLQVLVDSTGLVRYAEALQSSEKISMDNSAVIAAYKCKYKPAQKDGKPVAVWVTYLVEFHHTN